MKGSWTDAVVLLIVLIICAAGVVIGLLTNTYGMLMVSSILGALILVSLSDLYHAGFQPTTRFERFEFRILMQTIVIFFGGGALVAAAYFANIPWVPLLLGWLLLSGYSARRLRGKSETTAAYQQRVGYNDES